MRFTLIFLMSTMVVLLVGGCCKPCEPEDLGAFELTSAEKEWTKFAQNPLPVVFRSSSQTDDAFSIQFNTLDSEILQTNCEDRKQCGICCDQYEAGLQVIAMINVGSTRRFDFALRKDFLTNSPTSPPDSVGAYMDIRFDSSMGTLLTGLPDRVLTGSISLNGQVYTKVFAYELKPEDFGNRPDGPAAFYFTKEDGIVGFKLVNGQVWNRL